MRRAAWKAVPLFVLLLGGCGGGDGRLDGDSDNRLVYNEDWRSTVLPPAPPDVAQRIQDNRTAQVLIVLRDSSGQPLAGGQDVSVEMISHEFLFGCNLFMWDGFSGNTTLEGTYRSKFAALFNYATLPFYWST